MAENEEVGEPKLAEVWSVLLTVFASSRERALCHLSCGAFALAVYGLIFDEIWWSECKQLTRGIFDGF